MENYLMETTAAAGLAHQRNHTIEDELRDAARYTETGVLITAESTETVEDLASHIHAASGRATFPFVQEFTLLPAMAQQPATPGP